MAPISDESSERRDEPALRVLYQDESCVVVDKPSGVIVHRGWANDDRDLLRMTRDALGRYVYPLHRLDRGASGAVLFALDQHAARTLNRGFAEGGMGKRYLALTRGHPPEHGLIDHPVPRAPGEERVPAQTEFTRLGTFERYALVLALPKTGRLHQIRRHLKHLSCPLIGDVKYGKGEHNRWFREQYAFDRLALHAAALSFAHPVSGERITVRAPLSGSFASCLEALALMIPARAAMPLNLPGELRSAAAQRLDLAGSALRGVKVPPIFGACFRSSLGFCWLLAPCCQRRSWWVAARARRRRGVSRTPISD